jgi:hypothetical protein
MLTPEDNIPPYAFVMSQDYDIPSFAFKNYYCIFITKKAASHFAKKINATSWRHQAVEVWESTDQKDDLAVIVIPKAIDFWKVEECLFEFKSEDHNKDVIDSDFWGQPNIGYKTKAWNLVKFI